MTYEGPGTDNVCKKSPKSVCVFWDDFSFWKPFEFDECVKMDLVTKGDSCVMPQGPWGASRLPSSQRGLPPMENQWCLQLHPDRDKKSTNGHWLFLVPIKGGIFPANWGIIYGTDPTY